MTDEQFKQLFDMLTEVNNTIKSILGRLITEEPTLHTADVMSNSSDGQAHPKNESSDLKKV